MVLFDKTSFSQSSDNDKMVRKLKSGLLLTIAVASFALTFFPATFKFFCYWKISSRLSMSHPFASNCPQGVQLQPSGRDTRSKDIVFTIKTTKAFHDNRLDLIMKTWFESMKSQVGHYLMQIYNSYKCHHVYNSYKCHHIEPLIVE